MGLQMSSLNGNPLASNLLNPAGGTAAQAYDDDDGPVIEMMMMIYIL